METCTGGLSPSVLDFGLGQTRWILQTGRGATDSTGSWLVAVNWWWFIWTRFKEKIAQQWKQTLAASGTQNISNWQPSTANVYNYLMIALKDARTLSCWDAHFSYVLTIALCFQIIHIIHIAPVGLPSLPPRDPLNPITVTITSLSPADVPHSPPFPTLLMSSRTATGWHLLKLCTHRDLTHWDGKKAIFCTAGALLSPHSFPNYQLRLSPPHLHFAASFRRRCSVALFSLQTNFERLSTTVDAKCHQVGGSGSQYWSVLVWLPFNPSDRNCDVLSVTWCTVYWQHCLCIGHVVLLFWVW